jgi:Fe-Mn family superoxide dismutase
MPIGLAPLPYPSDALEPHISARTLQTHHGKHHRAYVDKANALLGESRRSLTEIILRTAKDHAQTALFNNAAQAWNHAFYWNSLRPKGATLSPQFARYVEPLKSAAKNHFGSGWAWLVREGNELKVVTTGNADNPLLRGQVPLLTVDVWEHAYYLDHQERRAAYVDAVVEHLLNWDFAAANLRSAEK